MEMPKVPPGELLCDGCWAVSSGSKACWMTYRFKHLKQTNLCPNCIPNEHAKLTQMQGQGM